MRWGEGRKSNRGSDTGGDAVLEMGHIDGSGCEENSSKERGEVGR